MSITILGHLITECFVLSVSDGFDVCLFGMFAQTNRETSKTKSPNTRTTVVVKVKVLLSCYFTDCMLVPKSLITCQQKSRNLHLKLYSEQSFKNIFHFMTQSHKSTPVAESAVKNHQGLYRRELLNFQKSNVSSRVRKKIFQFTAQSHKSTSVAESAVKNHQGLYRREPQVSFCNATVHA